jgi:hypothetical protein
MRKVIDENVAAWRHFRRHTAERYRNVERIVEGFYIGALIFTGS